MVSITLGLGHVDQFSTKPQEEMIAVVHLPAEAVQIGWQMPQGGGGQNGLQNGLQNGRQNGVQNGKGQNNSNGGVPPPRL